MQELKDACLNKRLKQLRPVVARFLLKLFDYTRIDDVEDLTQVVLLKLSQKPHLLHCNERQTEVWLWKVARSAHADFFRYHSRQKRQETVPASDCVLVTQTMDEFFDAHSEKTPFVHSDPFEMKQIMDRIKQLSTEQREVLLLAFLGVTISDTPLLKRARYALRKLLDYDGAYRSASTKNQRRWDHNQHQKSYAEEWQKTHKTVQ